jgi:hypothetical protein
MKEETWVEESRMLTLCALPRSTFQSWDRSGLVARDPGGAYTESAVIELGLLSALREHFSSEELARTWKALREEGAVDVFVSAALALGVDDRFDLILEPHHGGVALAMDDAELLAAVRHPMAPRSVLVLSLAEKLQLIRQGFSRFCTDARRPLERKVGRPARRVANLRSISDRRT